MGNAHTTRLPIIIFGVAELTNRFLLAENLHLPEAGHLLIAEYPQVVNEANAEFIPQLS